MTQDERKVIELALEALRKARRKILTTEECHAAIMSIKEALAQPEHDLYTDADKDKPDAICDGNGQVALAMCKKCGKAEIELDEPCVKPQPEQEPVAVVDVHEFYDNCANFSLLQKLPKGKHTLYTTPPQRKPLTDEWVPVTQKLLNEQHPWLYQPMWIAMKGGVVVQGYYEWRQGRNPDRFITDLGDEWAFNADFVMPITKPAPPAIEAAHCIKGEA